jgi:DNA-binding MarR family transcriptional regulator
MRRNERANPQPTDHREVRPVPAARFDLDASLGFLVYKAHQRSFGEIRRLLEAVRLTPPQFGVLAALYGAEPETQAALCERGAVDPNTMVGILDRLEAAGLAVRDRDDRDRRVRRVRITPRGRRVFERCLPLQREAAKRCWAGLSAAERSRLRSLLQKALRSWKPHYGREVHDDE